MTRWFMMTLSILALSTAISTGNAATSIPIPVPEVCAALFPVANQLYSEIIEPSNGDLDLIDQMIVDQTLAIRTANSALRSATDRDVQRIALRITESHVGELHLLQTWRSTWYPDAPLAATNPPTPRSGTATSHAAATPEAANCIGLDFDRAFLIAMIEFDRIAMKHALYISTNAEHEDLRNFAITAANARSAEINLMESRLEHLDP